MNDEISTDLPMETLLDRYPGARRALFSAFHIGGCQSCAYQLHETLGEVCANHGIDPEEALACLVESRVHDLAMLISPADLQKLRESHMAERRPLPSIMTQDRQTALFADPTNTTKKIILIDHQGRSVLDHCAWFRGHGLKETYGIDGGIDRYAREIDPTIPRYRLEMD